ncbi:lasso RiPP family leader peptide-containing protein [Flindersiella endophytica]|jgi:hypothetical protein
MEREAYETPQLVLLGDAKDLVKGELVEIHGDNAFTWWC